MSTGSPPAAGRGVDDDELSVGPGGAPHRHGNPRRRLVVRPGDDVHRRIGLGFGCAAGIGLDDDRVADERVLGDGRGELGAELAVGQVQRPLVDEAEGGGVPEGGGPAVAEHHLVAVGNREQLPQPGADPADQVLDGRLPVRRAEQLGARGHQRLQLFGPDLRRSAPEPAVGGFEGVGNRQLISHAVKPSEGVPGGSNRPPSRRLSKHSNRLWHLCDTSGTVGHEAPECKPY